MFKKIKIITKAWIKASNHSQLEEEVAQIRLKACLVCIFAKTSWVPFSINYCSLCGCPLSRKIYSPAGKDECSENNWPI